MIVIKTISPKTVISYTPNAYLIIFDLLDGYGSKRQNPRNHPKNDYSCNVKTLSDEEFLNGIEFLVH